MERRQHGRVYVAAVDALNALNLQFHVVLVVVCVVVVCVVVVPVVVVCVCSSSATCRSQ